MRTVYLPEVGYRATNHQHSTQLRRTRTSAKLTDYQEEKMSQEIDETIKRIQGHKGVIGVIIVNNDGIPLKSTLDNTTSVHYASQIHSLASKARAVIREIDSSNDLRFLRVRSKKHEILVAPDHDYFMIVIQKDGN